MKKIEREQITIFFRTTLSPELISRFNSLATIPVDDWPNLFHANQSEKCFKITIDNTSEDSYFCKYYSPVKSCRKRLRYFFDSPTKYAFRMSNILLSKGIATPRPVCYIHFKNKNHTGATLYCTEWIRNSQPLGPYSDIFFQERKDVTWIKKKRSIIRSFADFVAAIHIGGVYHGDFNINNIIIVDGLKPFFYLIDTGDVRTTRGISNRRILKNLDEVNRFFLDRSLVTLTDRYRFLKEYFEYRRAGSDIIKEYWGRIYRRTKKRLVIHGKEFVTSTSR